MTPEELGFALLLSVPVGAGVSLATLRMAGDPADPLVIGSGVVTALAIFLFIVAAVAAGADDE